MVIWYMSVSRGFMISLEADLAACRSRSGARRERAGHAQARANHRRRRPARCAAADAAVPAGAPRRFVPASCRMGAVGSRGGGGAAHPTIGSKVRTGRPSSSSSPGWRRGWAPRTPPPSFSTPGDDDMALPAALTRGGLALRGGAAQARWCGRTEPESACQDVLQRAAAVAEVRARGGGCNRPGPRMSAQG